MSMLDAFNPILALIDRITQFKQRREVVRGKLEKKIDTVLAAVLATQAYLHDLNALGKPDRERERQLSELWGKAASAVRDLDRSLAYSAFRKAEGWADPRKWEHMQESGAPITIDLIKRQCEWLLEHPHTGG